MPAILLTHPKGATITTLDSSNNLTSSTPLPIPSRFPSTSTPQTAVSPSGHIYLWCDEVNVVWEYDNKGKRVGEIVVKTGPIKRVLGAGRVDGKEMAVVELEQGLGLWSKTSTGKWEPVKHLDAPKDLVALAADADFGHLAALGAEELLMYDMRSGSRESIFLAKDLYREPAVALAFASPASKCILVASAYAVLKISLSHGKREIREISTGNEEGHILAVCTLPAGPGGSAACAILRDEGRISICGLETPDGVARMVTCSQEFIDISSVNHNQVIGRTANGKVYLQSIDHSSSKTVPMPIEEHITGVHVLASPALPPTHTSGVRRSASASVLGESGNAANIQALPPSSQSGGNLKGKGKATSESTKAVRVVSAPSRSQQAPAPRPLSSRSTSQPIARQPRPSSSMAHLPAIQDEEEEEDIPATSRGTQHVGGQSLDLTWAWRSSPATQITPQPSLDVNSAEELRREISNLQLDMLRMARGLKNEIRNAIKPLVDELRDSRETNERQRLEIERLRRGY